MSTPERPKKQHLSLEAREKLVDIAIREKERELVTLQSGFEVATSVLDMYRGQDVIDQEYLDHLETQVKNFSKKVESCNSTLAELLKISRKKAGPSSNMVH